jgi:GNAT superfamily N-acetyltransferase
MDFYIKTGKENMQIPIVGNLLRATYWANDRSDEIVEKSMLKSDCYGAFLKENDLQIGFARIVTDDATFFWLCDVVVDENYRGHGIGKKLMETIKSELKYKPMAGILGTLDAHTLYEKIGFVKSGNEKLMRKPKGV